MASHGNDNLGKGVSPDNMDKKTWRTPLMEKLDVTVLTQSFEGTGGDGGVFS